ncbi:MAG: TSUP family transporter [Vicinamibacterales bacterium]
MLGFEVTRDQFVATATAVALLVDLVRLPIYLLTEGAAVALIWPLVAMTTVGVALGTLAGGAMLRRIPEPVFRRAVGVLVLLLGIAVLVRGGT